MNFHISRSTELSDRIAVADLGDGGGARLPLSKQGAVATSTAHG